MGGGALSIPPPDEEGSSGFHRPAWSWDFLARREISCRVPAVESRQRTVVCACVGYRFNVVGDGR